MRTLWAGFTICALAGCASAPGDHSVETQLKRFPSLPGAHSVYVCREATVLPYASVDVLLDGEEIGSIKTGNFAHAVVPPGPRGVSIRNPLVRSGVLSFDGKAGEISIIWVGVTGNGWGALTVDHFGSPGLARNCVTSGTYVVGPRGNSDLSAAREASASAPTTPVTAVASQTPVPSAPAIRGGQDSPQVERLAEVKACNVAPRSALTAKGPGFETYTVACTNGDALTVRCEFGNCRVLK